MSEKKKDCNTCVGCWITCSYEEEFRKSGKEECEHYTEEIKGDNLGA